MNSETIKSVEIEVSLLNVGTIMTLPIQLFSYLINQSINKTTMKKLINKLTSIYYLVVIYFLTFAAILMLTSSCKTPSYAGRHRVDACPNWADCILNPENKEYVTEVAFNLNIKPEEVTQEQFNKRYND